MRLLTALLAFGCAWYLTRVPAGSFAAWSALTLGLVSLLALVCWLSLSAVGFILDRKRSPKDGARDAVIALIEQHLETLARRRLSLVRVDHYGVAETEGWDRELKRFAKRVVEPGLSEDERSVLAEAGDLGRIVANLVEARVAERVGALEVDLEFDPDMTPAAFEAWCAERLARAGWRSKTVGASGDQGADVIAERGRLRAVIQCKLYQSPVGNKAVQEAHAARAHFDADIAAVVASGGFTPAAKHLAATTGVLLLLHSEIDRFDEVLAAQEGP